MGEMRKTIYDLQATVVELKAELGEMRKIPLLELRMGQMERVIEHDLAQKVADLWAKVFSMDKHFAVTQAVRRASSPDLGLELGTEALDEDPRGR